MKLSQDTCFDGCTVLQTVLEIPHKTFEVLCRFFYCELNEMLSSCFYFVSPSGDFFGLFSFPCPPSFGGGFLLFKGFFDTIGGGRVRT